MYSDTDENDLTPNNDGSSQTDTNNTDMNNNNTSDPQDDKVDGSETSQPKKPISEARLRANRQNAQKSTGPKTARGKGHSRRNALKHGLLSKKLLFSDNGQPIHEELHQLWESLHEKYGDGDVRTNLLVDGIVIEHWRQSQALVVELSCFQSVPSAEWHFGPQGSLSNVQRYRTASEHALLKRLELLEELPLPASESDEDEGEGETPTPRPEDPPPALESTSSLTLVAAEQGSPECGSQSEDEAANGENSTPTAEEEEAA
jgi:hypothetical protein